MNSEASAPRSGDGNCSIVACCLLLFLVLVQLICIPSEAVLFNQTETNETQVLVRSSSEIEFYDYLDLDENHKTYGVIVDCGSSGTRANIFVWKTNLGFPKLLNHIEPLRDEQNKPVTKKETPGLSSLSGKVNEADEYMKKVIDFISESIPEESHISTSIYVMATAGMRLLDENNQKAIIEAVALYMTRLQKFAKVRASIISGSNEGMYQWITVNSKSQRFVDRRQQIPNAPPTIGIIEMGGASLQVAYQIIDGIDTDIYSDLLETDKEAADAFEASLVEPELAKEAGSYSYKLFSTSFLGFGSNSAREAYVDWLIANSAGGMLKRVISPLQSFLRNKFNFKFSDSHNSHNSYSMNNPMKLKDPCMPRGASQTYEKPSRMLQPAQNGKKNQLGYTVEANEEKFLVMLEGTGNYNSCKRFVKLLLEKAKEEGLNCPVGAVCPMKLLGTPFVAFDRFQFYGLADFYYTTNLVMELAGNYNHDLIVRKTRKICETHHDVLKATYPEATRDPTRITLECFKAVFVDTFLVDGLMMREDYRGLETIGQINGDALEWTLGAVIDKSASIDMAS